MSDLLLFKERFDRIQSNVELMIHGKTEHVRLALVCLFAEGHLLIEDVPGVAKTSLAKAIAMSMVGGTFQRVQFTPDLLPSDVTGGQVIDLETRSFQFNRGPVFSHVLLGDEINRASPKTQSALLQVMAEREVTAGRETYALERPFLCIATQNPIEQHGTYPLPEAQLDRFLMRISMGGHPRPVEEKTILAHALKGGHAPRLRPVLTIGEIINMIDAVRTVHVSDSLQDYLVAIADATRTSPQIQLGVSPRGTIALAVAAQARAACMGRSFASPDDVKAVAIQVLGHRLLLDADAEARGATAEKLLTAILADVPVPRKP